MTTSSTIGQKLWNYCNVLRDAGLSYGDYLEQLTYLIFLKMMSERSRPPYTLLPDYRPPPIPDGFDWSGLLARDGVELEIHYRRTLETLGRHPGTLGVIFSKAQNKIQEPAMLTRLIKELIDSENWLSLSADVQGRRLRVAAGAQRPGRQDRRRAVLHSPPADPGHRRRDAPRTRYHDLRPRLRHRRLPARRPRLHSQPQQDHGSGPAYSACGTTPCTAGRSSTAPPG